MGRLRRRSRGSVGDVIDLRERRAELRGGGPGGGFAFGFPTKCPECEGPGYLEQIDLHRMVQHERCPTCGSRWSHSESEVQALNG